MQRVSVTVIGRDRVQARVKRIKTAAEAARSRVAHDAADLVRGSLRSGAPVRRGNLRNKISYRTTSSGDKITVRFKAPWYTHFVTRGTKAHDIWAGFYSGKSDKRFLFFDGSGTTHVKHPGARANDFVKRAYDASRNGIREIVQAAGRTILGR